MKRGRSLCRTLYVSQGGIHGARNFQRQTQHELHVSFRAEEEEAGGGPFKGKSGGPQGDGGAHGEWRTFAGSSRGNGSQRGQVTPAWLGSCLSQVQVTPESPAAW